MNDTLHVTTACYTRAGGRSAVAAVSRWAGAGAPRIVARRLKRGDPVPPAYRALLLALWDARRSGARQVIIATDDADVAAQLAGESAPGAETIGPYLQVRALMHAFRAAELRCIASERNYEAIAAAAAAVDLRQPVAVDLPLWKAAS